ncbi:MULTISPECIES: DUF317 domain-containing protein [unclassified Kitasatospora]|uniref:DUF317 domain-containing protein n=1 Tax=unclassified Kitasatospora TaxID=2633591 RepID=UPI000AB0EED2|nr:MULTISPECIES: DUF317 domain-containing protein [unclassified Kitasatospora]
MAGPGDAEAALAHFLETSPTWGRYSPGQDTTVALHESLLAAIELDHDTTTGPRWNIAAYASPVGERTWNATFCTRTPVEVVTAVAERLSHALTATSEAVRDELLWGRRSLDNTIAADLEAAADPWQRETAPVPGVYSYTRPDDTAGIAVNHNIGDIRGIGPTVTVWGGPRGYPSDRWHAAFTGHTPNALISAALDEVVNPLPALRQRLQIPAANRTQVHLEPCPRRHLPPGTGQQSAREGLPAEPGPAGPGRPDPNAVTIRRTDEGAIVASGGDEHTAFLVGTTGFAPTPGSPNHYTLPTGHQHYEEKRDRHRRGPPPRHRRVRRHPRPHPSAAAQQHHPSSPSPETAYRATPRNSWPSASTRSPPTCCTPPTRPRHAGWPASSPARAACWNAAPGPCARPAAGPSTTASAETPVKRSG